MAQPITAKKSPIAGKINFEIVSSSVGSDYDYSYIKFNTVNKSNIDKFKLNTRVFAQYGTGTNPQGGFGIEVKSFGNVIFNWDAGSGWSDIERGAAMRTDASSGLGNINIENVSIFPNPASDVLNISFNAEASTYNVAILDLQGRVLATESGSQNVTFPVGDLSAGSYLVTISTESGVYTENVVIK